MTSVSVDILLEGYMKDENDGSCSAVGSVTLVRSPNHWILVDTGGPRQAQQLTKALESTVAMTIGNCPLTHIICTHGHIDHIGNLALFTQPNLTVILDHDIFLGGDRYTTAQFPMKIGEYVEVVETPGHTDHDLSVIVQKGDQVWVAAGDLFECEYDIEKPELWRANSKYAEKQAASRDRILKIADFIIPGHGKSFAVPKRTLS